MSRLSQCIATFLIIWMLTACGVVAAGDTPEKGAQEFLQALADSDGLKMDDRTCNQQKAAVQQGSLFSTALGTIGESLVGQKAKIDISEVSFATARSEGDLADVNVTGRIRAAVGLIVQANQLNTTWIMAREDGKWKYCGGSQTNIITANTLPPQVTVANTLTPDRVPGFLLQQILLQKNEVPTEVSVIEFELAIPASGLDTPGFSYSPQEKSKFLEWGLVAVGARIFCNLASSSTNKCTGAEKCATWCQIQSQVYYFRDLSGARSLYQYFNENNKGFGGPPFPVRLGDEGTGIPPRSGSLPYHYSYLWRSNNMVLYLDANVSTDKLDESEARKLAEKMQAHLH